MSKKMTERESLHEVYSYVWGNWAVTAGEIADQLGLSVSRVNALLRKLNRARLVESLHVNNERALTWQSYYDIENEDGVEARAERDFAEAFPGEPETRGGHTGGSGPRYTPEQIAEGVRLTLEGETAKAVALAVGVKSPNYFRKVIKEKIAEAEKRVTKRGAKLTGTVRPGTRKGSR